MWWSLDNLQARMCISTVVHPGLHTFICRQTSVEWLMGFHLFFHSFGFPFHFLLQLIFTLLCFFATISYYLMLYFLAMILEIQTIFQKKHEHIFRCAWTTFWNKRTFLIHEHFYIILHEYFETQDQHFIRNLWRDTWAFFLPI